MSSTLDPAAEFARIKYSVLLLENHFTRGYRREPPQTLVPSSLPVIPRSQSQLQAPISTTVTAPGLYGSQNQNGLYTGPTSVASHLAVQGVSRSRSVSAEPEIPAGFSYHDYDTDLIDLLPPFYIMDGMIEYYFEYCTWVYWMVNKTAFLASWRKFKDGTFPDRLVLATASFILALALRYLPLGHDLLSHLPHFSSAEDHSRELSVSFHEVGNKALRRHQDASNVCTIELVEALLAKCHYFVIAAEPERTWAIRGTLVTIATAMGLHRDPDTTRFSRDAAERRRWAWWHIMFIDRQVRLIFHPASLVIRN
jgi:Fungal specific transcription factor domain